MTTKHVAPQEDRLQIPKSWTWRLLPRRGRRPGKPVPLPEPEAVDRLQEQIRKEEQQLRAALANPANESFAEAGTAYLDGKADPRGAAAVAGLLLDYHDRLCATRLRPEFDLWLRDHGLPFAVASAVEMLALAERDEPWNNTPPIARRVLNEAETGEIRGILNEVFYKGLNHVRALLAGATDDEYAAALAAVAAQRDTAAKGITAMVLLPDEYDWALEACAVYGKVRHRSYYDMAMWLSVDTPEQVAAMGLTDMSDSDPRHDTVGALLDGLGTDAFPILAATEMSDVPHRDAVIQGIAVVPTDEAMAFLLEHLERPHVFEAAADAARRFPFRALRIAAKFAPSVPAELRPRLAAIAALPDPALHVHLSEAERAALADLATAGGRVPDADVNDLPPLLVSPPWTRKRPKTKAVVIDGLEAPAPQLRWAEGEEKAWRDIEGPGRLSGRAVGGRGRRRPSLDWQNDAGIDAFNWNVPDFLAFGRIDKAEPYLPKWNGDHHGTVEVLQRILGRYGETVLGRVLKVPAEYHDFTVLPGPILSRDAARIAAERYTDLKSARPSAIEWFERHGLDTVPYLVPDALGSHKERRKHAEAALVHLASLHGPEAVAVLAESFGPGAAEAIAALVQDPLEPRGVKIPKPISWSVSITMPQVLLKGGKRALPHASIPHLVTVLMLATPDYRYPGLDVVTETCDHDSLRRFSTELFERWLREGAPSKESWALTQLAHFADDATVWTLAPLIAKWPGENQHKRAVKGLAVLGAIGSEAALRAIQGIADKVKFKALKEEARGQITAIAEELGLSREQLADRLVPTFGLDEAAALVIDYGTRKFTVAFDEHLVPFVKDEDGKPRKALPKPGKNDAEFAADSYKRFAAFKKELKAVAANQVTRMEAAMVAARTWTPEEFRRYFAEHPLNRHLSRRLVWLADMDDRRFGFRIAEDGSLSDVEDDAVELPESTVIRVAHPVHLGPEQTKAWAEVLADYEILQPFDQLARPVMAFTEEELATGRLARFEGATVEIGRILGATNRGWKRAKPEDAGVEPGIAHPLPGGGFLTVSLEPGIWAGQAGESPEQKFAAVRLCDREYYWWAEAEPDGKHPKHIDPATASEILSWLSRLTGIA